MTREAFSPAPAIACRAVWHIPGGAPDRHPFIMKMKIPGMQPAYGNSDQTGCAFSLFSRYIICSSGDKRTRTDHLFPEKFPENTGFSLVPAVPGFPWCSPPGTAIKGNLTALFLPRITGRALSLLRGDRCSGGHSGVFYAIFSVSADRKNSYFHQGEQELTTGGCRKGRSTGALRILGPLSRRGCPVFLSS